MNTTHDVTLGAGFRDRIDDVNAPPNKLCLSVPLPTSALRFTRRCRVDPALLPSSCELRSLMRGEAVRVGDGGGLASPPAAVSERSLSLSLPDPCESTERPSRRRTLDVADADSS